MSAHPIIEALTAPKPQLRWKGNTGLWIKPEQEINVDAENLCRTGIYPMVRKVTRSMWHDSVTMDLGEFHLKDAPILSPRQVCDLAVLITGCQAAIGRDRADDLSDDGLRAVTMKISAGDDACNVLTYDVRIAPGDDVIRFHAPTEREMGQILETTDIVCGDYKPDDVDAFPWFIDLSVEVETFAPDDSAAKVGK